MPSGGGGSDGNGAGAAHDASQKLIHTNAPRLAFYEEESNMGKGFIKVQKRTLLNDLDNITLQPKKTKVRKRAFGALTGV